VFGINSTVTIDNCWFHDNQATVGGAVYLYKCSASMTGNVFEQNVVVVAGAEQPWGAGVALEQCSAATLSGNTFDSNTGAQNGGALWIRNTTSASLNGDTIQNHTASFYGGGVYVSKSDVGFDGVTIADNSSSIVGGGVALVDTSAATIEHCDVAGNGALLGAGVYFDKGELTVRHNRFVSNSASNSGGAILMSGVTAGEVVGNTMDLNAGASGTGGLQSADSPIEVYNNIITNSTGHGVACSGTLPTLSYNDVWNSTGDDYNGCAAGVGSISLDPVYVNAGPDDYHLGVHSPAIDAGRPGVSYEDPDGSRGDMGRFGSHMFSMDQPSYPKNLVASLQAADVVLTWSKNPEPDIAAYNVYSGASSGFTPSAGSFAGSVTGADSSINFPAPADSAFYVVSAVDNDGYAGGYSDEASIGTATSADGPVVYENRLYQNVPNPFNPSTVVRYELQAPGYVTLAVYDVAGRVVKRLVDGNKSSGVHTATWDGTSDSGSRVSSGIYFYKLVAANFVQTRKMVLLK
jgi:predicted outer membrane repeat protein